MMIPKNRLISGMVGIAVWRHADRAPGYLVARILGFFRRSSCDGCLRWKERLEGNRWTWLDTATGVAAHDLYHAGPVRLVKVLTR